MGVFVRFSCAASTIALWKNGTLSHQGVVQVIPELPLGIRFSGIYRLMMAIGGL
jgi:hypothetical protein